jgi:nitroreductase
VPADIHDLLALIRSRRSVRKFKDAPLPEGAEQHVLDAAIWAPSGGNAQPWHFVLVRDDEIKRKLCAAALSQRFVEQAPLVVVVCADLERAHKAYRDRGVQLYCLQDTAAATQNMLLAAHALGLGACWIGAFREKSVVEALALADHLRPVALVAIGVPDEEPRVPPRRAVGEVSTVARG